MGASVSFILTCLRTPRLTVVRRQEDSSFTRSLKPRAKKRRTGPKKKTLVDPKKAPRRKSSSDDEAYQFSFSEEDEPLLPKTTRKKPPKKRKIESTSESAAAQGSDNLFSLTPDEFPSQFEDIGDLPEAQRKMLDTSSFDDLLLRDDERRKLISPSAAYVFGEPPAREKSLPAEYHNRRRKFFSDLENHPLAEFERHAMLINSLRNIGKQAVPGDVVNIAGGQQARSDINLGSGGHNLGSTYSSPTVNAVQTLSQGLIDTGIHYGNADDDLGIKCLIVNHTDDPADPLIIHIIWIIIIAQERADLVNLLIDYLHDIGAHVFAFCVGGYSARLFMERLHTDNKSIDGPHAICSIDGPHATCFSRKCILIPTVCPFPSLSHRIQCTLRQFASSITGGRPLKTNVADAQMLSKSSVI